MFRLRLILPLALASILAACATPGAIVSTPTSPAATEAPTAQPTAVPTSAPTAEPTVEQPTAVPPTEAPALSFEPTTYQDDSAGFAFEYPAAWEVVDLGSLGDRGSGAQLLLDGEPQMSITLYQWDPKKDLDAWIAHRKEAWSASGFELVSEEELILASGERAARFVVQTPDEQALFFFTPAGDRYLELSGAGDLDLLKEITGTVRLLQPQGEITIEEQLNCAQASDGMPQWVACNVVDGIRSRNLSALHGYMTDPFTIGYWGSEGRTASPEEVTAELAQDRLPADASLPLTFTVDRAKFPALGGTPPEDLFGPDLNVAIMIYSEGWGLQGAGSALLYIVQDKAGDYRWAALAYSEGYFDK